MKSKDLLLLEIKKIVKSDLFLSMESFLLKSYTKIINEIETIARIPSPTFMEKEKAEYVYKRFIGLDLDAVEIDKTYNVIGKVSGISSSGEMAVTAHIDTVFPIDTELNIRRSGDKIYCPGIGDNSTSVGGMLAILESWKETGYKPPFDIYFLANSCEEGLGDLKGIKSFLNDYITAKKSINLKCILSIDGNLPMFCNKGIGSRRLDVKYQTEGGHSWRDFGKPSAIHALGTSISEIAGISVSDDPGTTFNIGVIKGGSTVNSIAENASMLIDIRSESTPELEALEDKIRSIINKTAKKMGVSFSVLVVGDRPSGFIIEDHPLVEITKMVSREYGITRQPVSSSTDSNIPLSMGIPALTIGIYEGNGCHTLKECIIPESLKKGLPSFLLILLNIISWINNQK